MSLPSLGGGVEMGERLTMSKVTAEERRLHNNMGVMSKFSLRSGASKQIQTFQALKKRPKSPRPRSAGLSPVKETIHNNPPWINLPKLSLQPNEFMDRRVLKKDRTLVVELDRWDPMEKRRAQKLKEYWKIQGPIAAEAAARAAFMAQQAALDAIHAALAAEALAAQMREDAAKAAAKAVRVAWQAAAHAGRILSTATDIAIEVSEKMEGINKSKRARKRWKLAIRMVKAVFVFGDKEVLLRRMLQNVQDAVNKHLNGQCPDVEVMLVPHKAIILKKPINFENGTADILHDSKPILHQVAQVVKAVSDIVIEFNYDMIHLRIEGHVNPTADAAKGILVSGMRANAVVGHMRFAGTPKEMLHPVGCGGTRPLGDPSKNRRVEVQVMSDDELIAEAKEKEARRASYVPMANAKAN
jgi:outer membrane protein OmpA-like peptidoglycan-associated protein